MTDLPFTVVEFDTGVLPQHMVDEVVGWVRSLGVVAEDVQPKCVICLRHGRYELHLSKMTRNEHGSAIIDYARNEVVTTPLVVDLGPGRTWPAFLNKESLKELALANGSGG